MGLVKVYWKEIERSSGDSQLFSHLSWFLTGKNLSFGNLEKVKSFLKPNVKTLANISLPNGLILSKHPNNIVDLKIDSYYKSSISSEIQLEKSSCFIFDKNFIVYSQVSQPSTTGLLFYPPQKSKTSNFVSPILSVNRILMPPTLYEECFCFSTKDFKVTVVFKPPRSLLSENYRNYLNYL